MADRDRELDMFGTTVEAMKQSLQGLSTSDILMRAMSVLSDVQDHLPHGIGSSERRSINAVKWAIDYARRRVKEQERNVEMVPTPGECDRCGHHDEGTVSAEGYEDRLPTGKYPRWCGECFAAQDKVL